MKQRYRQDNRGSRRERCRGKGFTLVEVIVVLAILAIIAAFATPGIVSYLNNARQTRQEETVRLLYSAAQNRLTYLSANDPEGKYTEFRKLFREGTITIGETTFTGAGTGKDSAAVPLDVVRQIGDSVGDPLGAPIDADGAAVGEDSAARIAAYSALYRQAQPETNDAQAVQALLGESGLYNVIEKGDCRIDVDPSLRFILRVTYQNVSLSFPSIYNDSNVEVPESADMDSVSLIPNVSAENGEKLEIKVSCRTLEEYQGSADFNAANFKLVVKMSSEKVPAGAEITLKDSFYRCSVENGGFSAVITLDSLESGKGFDDLFGELGFVPGEDVTVSVRLFYDGALTKDGKPITVTPSAEYSVAVNSLYAGVKNGESSRTVDVACGRHLQNLQKLPTGVPADVVQTGDINWNATQTAYQTFAADLALTPIVKENIRSFRGQNGAQHMISNLVIRGAGENGNTGMFDTSSAVFTDVILRNPQVSGTGDAGALAGSLTGGSLTNCSAYVTPDHMNKITELKNYTVTSTDGNAGGLVGAVSGSAKIERSFAALYAVSAGNQAGGLAGSFAGASVNSSYADTKIITGQKAGGFAGSIGAGSTVSGSYAVTEALSGTAVSAGFAAANSGAVTGSYALVGSVLTGDQSTGTSRYGFAPGSGMTDNYYYAASDFHAAEEGAGTKQSSIQSLAAAVKADAAYGVWEYDVYLENRDGHKAGESAERRHSHPYQTLDDYAYMADTEGTLAYPAPRIAGLDHYGSWPEPAAKYRIVFVFVNGDEDAAVFYQDTDAEEAADTGKKVADYNAEAALKNIDEYSPAEDPGPIECPVILTLDTDKLTYKDAKGGGHQFLGWTTGEISGASGSAISCLGTADDCLMTLSAETLAALAVDGTVTIKGLWTGLRKVSYLANPPTGAEPMGSAKLMPFSETYTAGKQVTVSGKIGINNLNYRCVKNDVTYLFTGWNTEAAGTGTAYAPGDTFTMPETDVDLYAQWEKAPTLAYDADYPVGTKPASAVKLPEKTAYPKNTPVSIIASPAVKDSLFRCTGEQDGVPVTYLFIGWNTDRALARNGEVEYLPKEVIPKLEDAEHQNDVTLYAVWRKLVRLYYWPNDHEDLVKPNCTLTGDAPWTVECYQGENVTLAMPGVLSSTNAEQKFECVAWYDVQNAWWENPAAADILGTRYDDTSATPKTIRMDSDTNLYAYWKQSNYNVRVTLRLDDTPWENQTVELRSAGRDSVILPYKSATATYKESIELTLSDSESVSYQIYVNQKSTGSIIIVSNRTPNPEETVDFYTLITRCGLGIEKTEQSASGANWYTDAVKITPNLSAGDQAGIYLKGTQIRLTATVKEEEDREYQFDRWTVFRNLGEEDEEEEEISTDNPLIVTAADGLKIGSSYVAEWPLDMTAESNAKPIIVRYVLVGLERLTENEEGTLQPTDAVREEHQKLEALTALFRAKSHYQLPETRDAIIVTCGGTALRFGTDYTWENGTLTLPEEQMTDNITVYINAIPDTYHIYFDEYSELSPDDVGEDYKKVLDEDEEPKYAEAPYSDGTMDGDTITNGIAEGNLICTFDKEGFVTIRPNPYYSLPAEDTAEPITVWCYGEEEDASTLLKLMRDESYSYSYVDEADGTRKYNTGVIVLKKESIPGKYVVIEADCVPTEYSLKLNLNGASAYSDPACTEAFDAGSVKCTHFDKDPTTFYLKAWEDTATGSFRLPETIVVRMNNQIMTMQQPGTTTGDYRYDPVTGMVTLLAGKAAGDITVNVVCEEKEATTTVYLYRDGVSWGDRNVELKLGDTVYSSDDPGTGFHYSNGAYIFPSMVAGEYDVYVDGRPVGKTITKEAGSKCSATVYFFTLEVKAGDGVQTVSMESGAPVFLDEGDTRKTFLSGARVTVRAELKDETNTEFGAWMYRNAERSGDKTYTVSELRGTMTLTARAKFDSFELVYRDYLSDDANGAAFTGTFSEADAQITTHLYGSETKLPVPTREGYNFDGWYTRIGEDEILYRPENPVLGRETFTRTNCPDHKIVLCAKWQPKGYLVYIYPETEYTGDAPEIAGWTWVGETGYYYTSYDITTEGRTLPLLLNEDPNQKLLGYQVTEGANSTWPGDRVLLPDDPFGKTGTVRMKALWGEVANVELTIRRNDRDWTHHGQTIELYSVTKDADAPVFVYQLENGSTYQDSYFAKKNDVAAGTYQVYVNGNKTSKTISVPQTTELSRILNLYSVTYEPHAEHYLGTVPKDSNVYLRGDRINVSENVGALVRTDEAGNKTGTLIGWITNENYSSSSAERYAFGSEITVNGEVRLYALWISGQVGIVHTNAGGTAFDGKKAGWDLDSGEALEDGDFPSYPGGLEKNQYYLFVSNDFGVESIGSLTAGEWQRSGITGGKKTVGNYDYYPLESRVLLSYLDSEGNSMIDLNGICGESGVYFTTRYLLSYHGNGADGGSVPNAKSFSEDGSETAVISGPGSMTRSGYTFTGWNTQEDGTGTAYAGDGTARKLMNGNLALYAQWEGNRYTLHFDLNGGSGSFSDRSMKVGEEYTLSGAPTKSGASFAGWALADDSTLAVYQTGEKVCDLTLNDGETATLTAVWGGTKATLTYDYNNGSGQMPTQTAYQNTSVYLLDTRPENNGKYFIGWKVGDRIYQPGEKFDVTGSVTLTAQWGDKVYWKEQDRWFSTLKAAVDEVNAGNQTLIFYGDTTETETSTISYDTTILSEGDHTASWTSVSSGNSCVTVSKGKMLTLGKAGGMNGTLTFDAAQHGRVVNLAGGSHDTNKTKITAVGGKMTMYDGVTLTNGYLKGASYDYDGAGVKIGIGGEFIMIGGTISDCTVVGGQIDDGSGGGGAVFMDTWASMQMGELIEITTENAEQYPYSGTTTYYKRDYSGISDPDNSQFNVNYGYWVPADGLTAEEYAVGFTPKRDDGSAVKDDDENVITHSNYAIVTGNPTITNCQALLNSNKGGDGGAICCRDLGRNTLNLYKGTISNCVAATKGGAIRSDTLNSTNLGRLEAGGSDVYTRIYELDIYGNVAPRGGAIYQVQGTIVIMNSDIHDNTAIKGGAIYADSYQSGERSLLEIENGRIFNNHAVAAGNLPAIAGVTFGNGRTSGSPGSGGAIYMGGGSYSNDGYGADENGNAGYTAITINGGSMYDNTAEVNGGGLYLGVHSAVCILNGGNIYDNLAAQSGTQYANDIYFENKNIGTTGEPKSSKMRYSSTDTGKPYSQEHYILTSTENLYQKLNRTEAAAGKKIVLKYTKTDTKDSNKLILGYGTVDWVGYDPDKRSDSKKYGDYHVTTLSNISSDIAWRDAQCFTFDTTAVSNPVLRPLDNGETTNYLVLTEGHSLEYRLAADERCDPMPPEKTFYAQGAPVTVTESIPTTNTKDESWFAGWVSTQTGAGGPYGLEVRSFFMPGADVVLTASWKDSGVLVTYDPNLPADYAGARVTVPVDKTCHEKGSAAEIRFDPVPRREGYLFLGWDTDPDRTGTPTYTADGTTRVEGLSADLTLYAVWERLYSVTYDLGEDSAGQTAHQPVDPNLYQAGDTVKILFADEEGFAPQREGSAFLGWTTVEGSSAVMFRPGGISSMTAENESITLYAVWTPGYKVIYRDYLHRAEDERDDSDERDVRTGKYWHRTVYDYQPYSEGAYVDVLEQAPAEREGFRFLGWSPEQNGSTPLFPVGGIDQKFRIGASDYYLYAVWEQFFRVDYYDYADLHLKVVETAYVGEDDPSVDLAIAPKHSELEFVGWALQPDAVTALDGLNADRDIQLYAIYRDAVRVTLHFWPGDVGAVLLQKGGSLSEEEITVPRPNYTFMGWYTDEARTVPFDFSTVIDSDLDLYAKWIIDRVTVRYLAGGGVGEMEPQIILSSEIGTQLRPNAFTRVGYSFYGWETESGNTFRDGEKIDTLEKLEKLAEDSELVAVWNRLTYSISFYLDAWDTEEYASIMLPFEEPIEAADKPEDPVRADYRFLGWDQPIPSTMPAGDMKLYAKWETVLSFNVNGGDSPTPDPISAIVGARIGSLPTDPTRNGYVFDGWYTAPTDGERETEETIVSAPHTLYAHWRKIHTVTFNLNGGDSAVPDPIRVVDGETIGDRMPEDPTWTNHVFTDWYTQQTLGDIAGADTPITGDTTLWAHWIDGVPVTVTLNGRNAEKVTLDGEELALTDGKFLLVGNGRTLESIELDGKTYTVQSGNTMNMSKTDYAFRSVSYYRNQSTSDTVSVDYAYSSDTTTAVTIPKPDDWTKSGARFLGWDSGFQNGKYGTGATYYKAMEDSVTISGETKLYAVWLYGKIGVERRQSSYYFSYMEYDLGTGGPLPPRPTTSTALNGTTTILQQKTNSYWVFISSEVYDAFGDLGITSNSTTGTPKWYYAKTDNGQKITVNIGKRASGTYLYTLSFTVVQCKADGGTTGSGRNYVKINGLSDSLN